MSEQSYARNAICWRPGILAIVATAAAVWRSPALGAAAAADAPALGTAAAADVRPIMHAIRVRDGSIKVDGRLDDWPRAAFAGPCQRGADSLAFTNSVLIQNGRGPWMGPDDLSVKIQAAVDSGTLYVSGTVHDQLMFNEGDADAPWVGDEFEVFVDANPPEKQFMAGTNENYAQFIFVPEHLWTNTRGTFVWRSAKYPAVVAASRLTPVGYTFEVAIPMDVVPYWKLHHELNSIGFDVQVGDLDSPGLIGHDAGPKITMVLLQPFPHFTSAAGLSTLQFDPTASRSRRHRTAPDLSLPGYEQAQKLLDHYDDPGIGRQANAALGRPDLARKAALFILSKRPELPADTTSIAAILSEPVNKSRSGFLLDSRVYAIMALAGRQKLPAAETLVRFGSSDDLVLQNTALWAVGLSGDRTVVPGLIKRFATTTSHTQEIVAISLARLGDRTSVSSLEDYARRDRGQTFGILSRKLLKELGIDYTLPPRG